MFNKNNFLNILLFIILIAYMASHGEAKMNCQIYSEPVITCFDFDFLSLKNLQISIKPSSSFSLHYKLEQKQVLRRKNVNSLFKFIEQVESINVEIMFSYLKGVESNVFIKEPTFLDKVSISLIFYNSKLIIFNSDGESGKCQSNHDRNSSIDLTRLQFSFGVTYGLVCPSFLNHLTVDLLSIDYLTNTFYKKNQISFINISMNYPNIFSLNLFYCENLKLEEKFLNKNIFKSLRSIQIIGKLIGIEENLLGKLKELTLLQLDIYFARNLFSQGIQWTKSVNKNSKNYVFKIQISHREFPYVDSDFKISSLFPDHDFCIYKNFPFENKIVLDVQDGFIYDNLNFTCTFNYIRSKNSNFNSNFIGFYSKLFPGEKNYCNFEKMVKNCQIKTFLDRQNLREFVIISEFIFVRILNPLSSFILVLLSLSFIFLFKNVKNLKQNLYFIKYYSFICLFYIILQLLSFINQCPFKTGLFCSTIRSKIIVQYYKKFIVDFFCEVLKFLLNFLVLSYNYYRFRFLTKSNFILTLSRIQLIFFFFLSLGLIINWSNILHSQINYSQPNFNYPISSLNSENIFEPPKTYLKYFNALSKIVNYALFIIFNLLVDFLIIRKLRKIVRHKMNFKARLNSRKNEKLQKINLKILRKTLINLLINLILKTPEFFPIFYSFAFFSIDKLKNLNFSRFDIFIETILIKYGLESLFESICEFSFILSLFNNFYFYFVSNKHFREIYFQKFFPIKK